MEEPTQIRQIRLLFARVVADDFESLLELTDPEPEYHNPEHAMEPGIRRGRDEFMQALRNISENFDFSELTIIRWAMRGDDEVLVEVRVVGTGRDSGAPLDQRSGYLYAFNGDLIARFEWFRSWDEAAAKAGFDPGTWKQSK